MQATHSAPSKQTRQSKSFLRTVLRSLCLLPLSICTLAFSAGVTTAPHRVYFTPWQGFKYLDLQEVAIAATAESCGTVTTCYPLNVREDSNPPSSGGGGWLVLR